MTPKPMVVDASACPALAIQLADRSDVSPQDATHRFDFELKPEPGRGAIMHARLENLETGQAEYATPILWALGEGSSFLTNYLPFAFRRWLDEIHTERQALNDYLELPPDNMTSM